MTHERMAVAWNSEFHFQVLGSEPPLKLEAAVLHISLLRRLFRKLGGLPALSPYRLCSSRVAKRIDFRSQARSSPSGRP
jgi:hypothetical protein